MFDVDRILAIPDQSIDYLQCGIAGKERAALEKRGFVRADGTKAKDYMIRTIQKTAKNKEKAVIKGDKKLVVEGDSSGFSDRYREILKKNQLEKNSRKARQEFAKTQPLPKHPKDFKFHEDSIPFDETVSGYGSYLRDPEYATKRDQENYVSYMNKLRDNALPNLPKGREQDLINALDAVKKRYIALHQGTISTGAYSSMMAGGSKFNYKQADRRNKAQDRANKTFSDFLKNGAESIIDKTTGIDKIKQDKAEKERIKALDAQIKTQKREKAQKQEVSKLARSLPIINHPSSDSISMTSAEWKDIPKDYKSINTSQDGTHKYRSTIHKSRLVKVHLSDKKAVKL